MEVSKRLEVDTNSRTNLLEVAMISMIKFQRATHNFDVRVIMRIAVIVIASASGSSFLFYVYR